MVIDNFLQEGVAAGRSSATSKNYHIDDNKEMIAFGMMNIAGSCTSCCLTTGDYICILQYASHMVNSNR